MGWAVAAAAWLSAPTTVAAPDTGVAPPDWAFTVNAPAPALSPSRSSVAQHVPGSSVAFTAAQINDYFRTPDWHPDTHPPMPAIVAYGKQPVAMPCGY